jgi:hypothetical protein
MSTQNRRKDFNMTFTKKRWIILLILIAAGLILGRLAVRAFMNLLLGGTLFGGNFL